MGHLSAFGVGLLVFIAIDGFSDIIHALATRYCFSPENRRAPLLNLLYIRLAVRAYNFLTPTAGLWWRCRESDAAAALCPCARGKQYVALFMLTYFIHHMLCSGCSTS